ncbi:MAG: UDP-3-O-[3-hydroxymyristoyl] N-acetylglucosamine deacetylase [Phycisphaeraceae bacterium]|nr:MAG: UDP-3-O-[3-hydroxymyristoyl] N-acetylglucosamine deacetylase [Phycisphaeraceae bacterium]
MMQDITESGRGAAGVDARQETSAAAGVMQRTLAGDGAPLSGQGLFGGKPSTATLKPAPAGHGVVFVRVDLPGSPRVEARTDLVIERPRRTTLKKGDVTVEMVEHCMSALSGLGVDNAVVELDGSELPAFDGSSQRYVEAIQAAGVRELEVKRRPIVITEPIVIRDGKASIAALPGTADALDLMYELDYGADSTLQRQVHAFTADPKRYAEQIAPARTYALFEEARRFRERGMFGHLTPRDILVIGDDGPIDNKLRFDDEPVRHKVLDLLGDLSLIGRPVQGRIIASRSGHAMNHRMARELLKMSSEQKGVGPSNEPAMNIKQVLRLLPHRYPMVLIDRVLEMEGDRRAVGIKNVTMNEPFFQGHYPGSPIMPGVLIVEAMSQLAGLMLSQKLERTGKIAVLLSLDNVKLRKAVSPGDQLRIETEAVRATNRFGDVTCSAYVDGRIVAEAQVKFMMVDAEQD